MLSSVLLEADRLPLDRGIYPNKIQKILGREKCGQVCQAESQQMSIPLVSHMCN